MKEEKINSIGQYIKQYPPKIQTILSELHKRSLACSPDLIETMSYQMPGYKLKKNMIHFGVNTNHIGIYPGPKAVVEFKDELSAYKTGKGSIQIPFDKPFPYDLYVAMLVYNIKNL